MSTTSLKNYKNLTLSELYDLNLHPQNRDIVQPHVNDLKKAIMDNGVDKLPPLQVGFWTNNILDGQYRREAIFQLVRDGKLSSNTRVTAQFVNVQPEDEAKYITNINNHQRQWQLNDFIESKVKAGDPNVIIFNNWRKKHLGEKGSYRIAMAILKGHNCKKEIDKGTFTITQDEIARGNNVYNEMTQIFNLFKVTKNSNNIEAFSRVWIDIRDEHTFSEWMKVFKNKTYKNRYIRNLDKVSTKREAWENVFNDAHRAIEKSVAA